MDPDSASSDRAQKIETLLSAALVEFARAGLDGARVDAIAESARMNKRLLYHYVGDKEALFNACLTRARSRVLREPRKLWPEEWRLLCHAAAAGRSLDLAELANRQDGESAHSAASRIGLIVLGSLLPELAGELLQGEGLTEIELEAAPEPVLDASIGPPATEEADLSAEPRPKPRLKLRPSLQEAAGIRSDSKRSK